MINNKACNKQNVQQTNANIPKFVMSKVLNMILRNNITQECIQLSDMEFKVKFAKELQSAIESYIKTETNKPYFKINKNLESEFYFDLQWNFNHFGSSNWYIKKI